MATQVQFRGGTTSEHSSFNGAAREVTVDTTKQTLVVQDGSTNGGFPLLRQDLDNLPAGTIDNADINASAAIAGTKIAPDFGSQDVKTTGLLEIAAGSCHIDLMETSSTNHRIRNGSGNFHIQNIDNNKENPKTQLTIDGGTGEVKLYCNGSTEPKFNTNADGAHVTGTITASGQITGNSSVSTKYVRMYGAAGTGKWDIYGHNANLRFSDNESAGNIHFDTNVGVGVVPSAWATNADFKAVQIGTGFSAFGRGSGDEDRGGIACNYYNDGTNQRYIADGHANQVYMNDGNIDFQYADSGSAGDPITFVSGIRMKSDGKVGIGITAPTKLLDLATSASADGIRIKSTGSTYNDINLDSNRSAANTHIARIISHWNGTAVSYISFDTGNAASSGKNKGYMRFWTNDGSGNLSRLRIHSDGDVEIQSGNLKVPSTKGIDFSSSSNLSLVTSELLDDYEEGHVVASDPGGNYTFGTAAGAYQYFAYTKIGNMVCCHGQIHIQTGSGAFNIALPFTPKAQWTSGGQAQDVGYANGALRLYDIDTPSDAIDFSLMTTNGAAQIGLYASKDNADSLKMTDISSGSYIAFSITYTTAT